MDERKEKQFDRFLEAVTAIGRARWAIQKADLDELDMEQFDNFVKDLEDYALRLTGFAESL